MSKILAILFLSTFFYSLKAQAPEQIVIDGNGVMHWRTNKKELTGFGVNYTLPFAHEYRMAKNMGVSIEEAIKQDVYHIARLDLDLYRVHVWDTEISDTLGNLINNDHLKLFDFAVNEMRKRGMKFIITPLAYWGNGWPETDEATPGFSNKYGKSDCLTNTAAILAQANYLYQFLNHVNTYTGIAYKNDPQVIGFEICNEPQHHEVAEKVTTFINTLVASMRKTGCSKPIFYNVTQNADLADAYLAANIQGCTVQWYPTNLVANHQINGNFLPQIENYTIPFANKPAFKKKAKIVYEFDPADVGINVMYPAMTRSFREAGMQLATQFAYDAMCWAKYNTNYGTHFMNLAYAPHKAISLKIASAVFHQVPMYQKHEDKNYFNSFRISYADDLAEWVTNEKFFYSNTTESKPAQEDKLQEIAGCGSSPLVKYTGTGAYFLDKLTDGVWRLEVMPDAYWIEDPYSPINPKKQKSAVIHAKQQIIIALQNLGDNFTAQPINKGNSFVPQVSSGQFTLLPGVYLLKRKNVTNIVSNDFIYKNIKIDEFVAPESDLPKATLWNNSLVEAVADKKLNIDFEVVSTSPIRKIQLVLSNGEKWETINVEPQLTNRYHIDIPNDITQLGFLNYRIIVEDETSTIKFPGGKKGDPWSWENRSDETSYSIRLIPANSTLTLWSAENDWEKSFKIWNRSVNLKPTAEGNVTLSVQLDQLPDIDPINKSDRNYAFKFFFGNKIKGRVNELLQKKFIVIKASNALSTSQPIEIGLIDKNGTVYAGSINLTSSEQIFKIPLSSFMKASYLIIPRPFPEFLPYKVQTSNTCAFSWSDIETLQLMINPSTQKNVNLNIEKIWLE